MVAHAPAPPFGDAAGRIIVLNREVARRLDYVMETERQLEAQSEVHREETVALKEELARVRREDK